MPFELDFPITRKYPWPHFTLIVLTVSSLILVGLTVLNVQLVGFETITRLEEDFNTSAKPFWLDPIIPKALLHGQHRDQCQPFVLKTGDSFVTNSSIFLWDLELVSNVDQGLSSLIYKGSTLRDCDVNTIFLNGNMVPPTMDVVVVVFCKNLDGFDVVAKTAFPISVLPGTYTRGRFVGELSSFSSPLRIIPYELIYLAVTDLHRYREAMHGINHIHSQGSVSAEISYTPCPASLGTNEPCAKSPPPINITSSLVIVIFNDTSFTFNNNSSAITEFGLYEPMANIIQTIHAAVQIDLGNPQENNFLFNSSVLNKTLYSQFPSTTLPTDSNLYRVISEGNVSTTPFEVEGPAKIEARYLCQVQHWKDPPQAFIAVLVATLSMFVSGWGLFTFLATYYAKRNNNSANTCAAHVATEELELRVGSRSPLLRSDSP